jgi:hypothetical protein
MFVTAEAVKGESWQSGQAQEAVGDMLFRIGAKLVWLRGVGLLGPSIQWGIRLSYEYDQTTRKGS